MIGVKICSIVNSRGMLTIPAPIRETMNIEPGDLVIFTEITGNVFKAEVQKRPKKQREEAHTNEDE